MKGNELTKNFSRFMRNAKKYPTHGKKKRKKIDEFHKLEVGKTFLTMTPNPEYGKILRNYINTNKTQNKNLQTSYE